ALRALAAARLEGFDAVLTHSTGDAAPRGVAGTGSSVCNRVWSALGWPALHLPTHCTAEGLPMGVQLVASGGRDLWLLRAEEALHPLVDRRAARGAGHAPPS